MPFPHNAKVAQHASGATFDVFVQMKLASMVQRTLHPSPAFKLPSSHISPFSHSLSPEPHSGSVSQRESTPTLPKHLQIATKGLGLGFRTQISLKHNDT